MSLRSRPGSWTGRTSSAGGKSRDQLRKTDAPPPANGKQKRRSGACGFVLGQGSQGLLFVVSIIVNVLLLVRFSMAAEPDSAACNGYLAPDEL